LRFGGARRVVVLVDRANLRRQTEGEFERFRVRSDGRKFTELYNLQRLTSNRIDPMMTWCVPPPSPCNSLLDAMGIA
jgi:type I restriction enzyme R subunit